MSEQLSPHWTTEAVEAKAQEMIRMWEPPPIGSALITLMP